MKEDENSEFDELKPAEKEEVKVDEDLQKEEHSSYFGTCAVLNL